MSLSWETTLSLSHELRGKCLWDTSLFSLFRHQVWAFEEQAEIIYKVLQDSKTLGVPFFCQSFPIAHSEVTRLPQSYIQSPGYPEQTSLQTKALSSLRRMVITWETEQGRLSRGRGPLRNEFRMLISARARITLHFYRRLKTLRMLQNSLVPKLKTGVGFPVLGERVTWPNCVILKPLGPSLPDMSTYNVTEGKYKCFWKRVGLEDWCSDLSLSLGTKDVSNLSKS